MSDTDALDAGLLAVADGMMDSESGEGRELFGPDWRKFDAERKLRDAILAALRAERVRGEESMRERAARHLRNMAAASEATLDAALLQSAARDVAALPTTDKETTP